MHPVCSIQLVCFTQTKLDACTNLGPSRCKDEKNSIKLQLIYKNTTNNTKLNELDRGLSHTDQALTAELVFGWREP